MEIALSLGRELHNIFLAFCLQRQLVIEAVKSLKINYVRTSTDLKESLRGAANFF